MSVNCSHPVACGRGLATGVWSVVIVLGGSPGIGGTPQRQVPVSRDTIAAIVPAGRDGVEALLGSGYSSENQQFRGRCLTGGRKFTGKAEANVSLVTTLTEEQLAESLGFSASGRAQFGVVSASASASFFREALNTSYSINAVYVATYTFKNVILSSFEKTPVGKEVELNDDNWKTTCGDQFVEQLRLGAHLYFSIRIDFRSTWEKSEFEAKVKIAGPMAEGEGKLQQVSKQFSRSSTVKVSALQIGGDVSNLSAVFGSNEEGPGHFVECTFGDLSKCAKVLKAALEYASSDKGFRAQIDPNTDPEKPDGPAVLGYVVKSYREAGIYPKEYPLLGKEITNARQQLSKNFEERFRLRLSARRALERVERLTPPQQEDLRKLINDMDKDITSILSASKTCYDTPTDCPAAEKGLKLSKTEPSILDLVPQSFAQFCAYSSQGEHRSQSKLNRDSSQAERSSV